MYFVFFSLWSFQVMHKVKGQVWLIWKLVSVASPLSLWFKDGVFFKHCGAHTPRVDQLVPSLPVFRAHTHCVHTATSAVLMMLRNIHAALVTTAPISYLCVCVWSVQLGQLHDWWWSHRLLSVFRASSQDWAPGQEQLGPANLSPGWPEQAS